MMQGKLSWMALLVLVGLGFGCGDEVAEDPAAPHVLALTKNALTLGETIHVAGRNFLNYGGRTELVFEGVFLREDNIPEETTFSITPLYDGTFVTDGKVNGTEVPEGTDLLRISRFGPFRVPFTVSGNKTGVFKGKLIARNVLEDGSVVEDPNPPDVTIDVKKSIAIKVFEPFLGLDDEGNPKMAECGAPALRAIQRLPYHLQVEAVGFEPVFFNYEFSGINGEEGIVQFSHPANGRIDDVGSPLQANPDPIIFNPVPENESFYVAAIRIQGVLTDGSFVETAMPITVHRPLEVSVSMAKAEPAQYYEPVPVSGCIPGSINTTVTYAESHSESRQNGVSVMIGKSWNQSHGDSESATWNNGIAETNTVSNGSSVSENYSEGATTAETYGVSYNSSASSATSHTSSDGENWNTSMSDTESNSSMHSDTTSVYGSVTQKVSVEVGAKGSVPGFAEVSGSVGSETGVTAGGSIAGTDGTVTGSASTQGSSMGGSSSSSDSYGSVTTDSKGESLSDTYALTSVKQLGSTTSQTECNSDSRTYSFGEGLVTSDVVSVGDTESWGQTWVNTVTDTTLMSYSSRIPKGRYGVWYRQAIRYVRKGQIYSYNVCGVREFMGEMYFNTWAWSPALALGSECEGSIMPQSDLPPAQCVIPPCD